MNIYISGISGTGMGPLALMAKAAGLNVCGSDLAEGAIYSELEKAGIEIKIGEQNGEFLQEKLKEGIDWFVYTSALSKDHPELRMAEESGIKCTKRDELTAFLVEKLGLKMVAVAGTHGKTTTTAMIVWAALKLGLPVSYIVGTTLGFAKSGSYKKGDKYFVYEADEYDRNFLKYHPWLSVIPVVSYDHPDIYPTKEDYLAAFSQFEAQSEQVIKEGVKAKFGLAGEVRRQDAALAVAAIEQMIKDEGSSYDLAELVKILDEFPGVGRRFERISDGVYSDYAHHPEEITATIEIAREECERLHKKGVVVIYQPHQNTRQYEVRDQYYGAFEGADKIYWLPTYLTRENPDLPVLKPSELAGGLKNQEIVSLAILSPGLKKAIEKDLAEGYIVVLMTAGPADGWLKNNFRE
ncbi:hypothetical protein IKF20_01780 [Candidatus Saccharibacteria bacterium]|nr:hypothetical protein [Candidatus Saccharibacteria bacterium]